MIRNSYLSTQTRYFVYILLFFTLSACGKDQVPLKRLSGDAVIVAFGDSLTFGTGAKPNASYPAMLEQLSGFTVVNAGIPGELSAAGLARLQNVLEKHKPELVILCHGGNDILRKKNLAQTKNNIVNMIKMIKNSNSDLILLGVPKPGIFLESAVFYQEIADQYKIVFYQDLIADILSDADLKSDPIHPNDKGYKIMAENIYQLLTASNAIQ